MLDLDALSPVALWRTMSGYYREATPYDGNRSSGTSLTALPAAQYAPLVAELREARSNVETLRQHLQLALDQWSPVRGSDEDDDLILKSMESALDKTRSALAGGGAS